MKLTSFLIKLRFLVLAISTSFSAFAGIESDSIRPLTKVNKEFLVVAHLVVGGDDTTNTGISENAINSQMAIVNTIFEPIGVSFKICEFRHVYNYQYDMLKSSTTPFYNYLKELTTTYNVEKRINMYFTQFVLVDNQPFCGLGTLGGIAGDGDREGVFIAKIGCVDALVIAHELGHYFSLPHTFQGSGSELVDGSNCATDGDGVCDTPADPYNPSDDIFNYISTGCVFYSTLKDANNQYYNPDVSNIMGYYSPCRCYRFSNGQYEKMAQYYLSHPVSW